MFRWHCSQSPLPPHASWNTHKYMPTYVLGHIYDIWIFMSCHYLFRFKSSICLCVTCMQCPQWPEGSIRSPWSHLIGVLGTKSRTSVIAASILTAELPCHSIHHLLELLLILISSMDFLLKTILSAHCLCSFHTIICDLLLTGICLEDNIYPCNPSPNCILQIDSLLEN